MVRSPALASRKDDRADAAPLSNFSFEQSGAV
jgi:hypothetical protein